MLYNVIPTIKTNGCSIFVNWIPRPFSYIFGHIHLALVIHGMMGVCSRFENWKLFSQLLWMLGVAQHWKGCSPHHKIKLPTFCPNLVLWLNSIPWVMKHVKRFECCYLLICMTLCVGCRGVKFWFFFKPCFNQKSTQEVIGIQSGESPNFENCGTFDLGVSGNMSFGLAPMANHKKNYKREGGASAKFGPW
jgi:hypothetical protein